MVYKVVLTNRALSDLKGICVYIAEDNADAAQKLGHELLDQIQDLEQLPKRGRVYDNSSRPEIYEVLLCKFRVFYQINEPSKLIEILRIRHGARSEPRNL